MACTRPVVTVIAQKIQLPYSNVMIHELTNAAGRFTANNELHARPFPRVRAPRQAICMAFLPNDGATNEDIEQHLNALLTRNGLAPSQPASPHYYGPIGRIELKWERHTEFFTYTIFSDRGARPHFDVASDLVPADWLASVPGDLLTACIVEVEMFEDEKATHSFIENHVAGALVPESTTMAYMLDKAVVAASDFRVDANGFVRYFLLGQKGTGQGRLGRVTQRLIEIETYKSMALLALPAARSVSAVLAQKDIEISQVAANVQSGNGKHNENLDQLLEITAELEALIAENSSRFSAAEAYEAIVRARVTILRETRFEGRQSFAEFMSRRFEPAMRTCVWTSSRLSLMAERASRVGDMLRTRIGVRREQQNADILASMNERAAQQLKLQETVEGLSVIAISYYAVGLLTYLLAPLASPLGVSHKILTASVIIPVILIVYWAVKRLRKLN